MLSRICTSQNVNQLERNALSIFLFVHPRQPRLFVLEPPVITLCQMPDLSSTFVLSGRAVLVVLAIVVALSTMPLPILAQAVPDIFLHSTELGYPCEQ
jgi:hypothetical protein